MAKTRIIATIGPASHQADTLKALKKAGMSVARLNGSHNTLDWRPHFCRRRHLVFSGG
ncbi:pyruvate kinase [Serratia ficaria]|uniref:pyruvate kinase n=1 Tax=Serratia TaxID=613 RepID=UPI001EEE4AAA|nr:MULTISPECIES: pyruvate kinase [Serratia]MEE4483592.1 pyruvate kinase [Serratia ficaria]